MLTRISTHSYASRQNVSSRLLQPPLYLLLLLLAGPGVEDHRQDLLGPLEEDI